MHIDRLLEVMCRLRDPQHGCPWDLEQNFSTIAPYTIEEAYEVAEAIAEGDLNALREELGDLLLQVVFHAQMASEQGAFNFADVVAAIVDKMVRRHPHVFADAPRTNSVQQSAHWEAIKAAEKPRESRLSGIGSGLPPLTRALKLQARAARHGFDWPNLAPVLAKLDEELVELKHEIDQRGGHQRETDEFGDVLFVLVNIARHRGIDPTIALMRCNSRFEARYAMMESLARSRGLDLESMPLAEQDQLWVEAKDIERGA